MSINDVIDSGFSPSRWAIGWRRFLLVRTLKKPKNDPKLMAQYQKYITVLVAVIGAQLNSDIEFLSADPTIRLQRMARLIERRLLAENKARKELIDTYTRNLKSPLTFNLPVRILETYKTAAQDYQQTGVKLNKYPDIDPSLVELALQTAHREVIEKMVKELVEPEIRLEIKTIRGRDDSQLPLRLIYKH